MSATMSGIKEDAEDAGESMKRGAKRQDIEWKKALKKQKIKQTN